MTKELRAAFEAQIEARTALNKLADNASDEDRSSCVQRLESADQKLAEILAKEPEGGGKAPVELRDKISLGRYLTAAASERKLDGAEAELRAELKLADNAVPLEALLPLPEERADAVSPQTTAGAQLPYDTFNSNLGTMLRRVFVQTDAAFLGVSMPMVPPGEFRYPVMTAGTTAAMQEVGGSPEAGAAKFAVVAAQPHRLTGRYVFNIEGVAEVGGLLESTLRADLRAEMGFQMDTQILSGSGASGQVSGLLKLLTLVAPPGPAGTFSTNDVAQLDWNGAKGIATDGLDGKYGRTEADIRLLIGGDVYTAMRTLYRADETDEDAVMALRALGVTLRRSFQIPAPAVATISPKNSNSSKKVQSAIMNMEPGAAVAPVWQGISLIRDPYTNAGAGQVVMTAHMMFDFVMRRTDGWRRIAIRTEK